VDDQKVIFESIKELRVFDALTAQIAIIFVIYAMVYITLVILENYFLPLFGSIGETFISVAHGFNFLIGILYALLFKKILLAFESKGKNINFLTNNYILSNISSLAFNFLIAAAVMTITIESIKEYYLLVIVMSIFASISLNSSKGIVSVFKSSLMYSGMRKKEGEMN